MNQLNFFSEKFIHWVSYFLSIPLATVFSYFLLGITVIGLGYALHRLLYHYVFTILKKRLKRKKLPFQGLLLKYRVFHKFYFLTLVFFLQWLMPYDVLKKFLDIIICLNIALLTVTFLSIGNDVYNTSFAFAKQKPIKSYTDIIKIITWLITIIFIVAILTNSAITHIFTGLGALSAILILVFRDPITGLITSIQISAYDIVRIGDWIQIKNYSIDGDVIDISLNAVKVQNFDKTVVTIPTADFMKHGIINFRGMHESGGRRIKRAIHIDIDTIQFCSKAQLDRLQNIACLMNAITQAKQQTLQLTNIGLYRQYIVQYLQRNHNVRKEKFTFLVRQLQPMAEGLPIEIYVFTNTTVWKAYEDIQSDIFDHLLAIAKQFDLRIFQHNKLLSSMKTS